jgi:TIR domain
MTSMMTGSCPSSGNGWPPRCAQTGEEFAIFQDRNDISWGQNWQQRIDEELDAVTLPLVIITPSLFRSPPCRAEFQRFVDRERALGRTDLILPVYYIGAREMDDPAVRESDEMAMVLASRQFADWRELRFEPFTSPLVRKSLAQLASRMRDTSWQPPAAPKRLAGGVRAASSSAASGEQADAVGQVTAKTEPPTHVVDVFPGRGDFTTVGAAIKAATPGDRILVRPGLYDEALVVDKPLEILGDGPGVRHRDPGPRRQCAGVPGQHRPCGEPDAAPGRRQELVRRGYQPGAAGSGRLRHQQPEPCVRRDPRWI